MPKDQNSDCATLTRLIRELCSCSENGAWSPADDDPHIASNKDPFRCEIAALRRRLLMLTKRRLRSDSPKLVNMTPSKENTMNTKTVNLSDGQQTYRTSNCGENWSLSRVWSNSLPDNFIASTADVEKDKPFMVLDKILPRTEKLRRVKKHDRDFRKIKTMLSLRMRRQLKRKHPKFGERKPLFADHQRERANIPKREFPKAPSWKNLEEDSFEYRSVMMDKRSDGTIVFDAKEARNMVLTTCHDFREDFDTLQIALRAGNFRSGRLAVEGWARGHAMPSAVGRTTDGALALHYAAARGCLDCVRLLAVSPESSANTAMDNDVTPVYLAAQEGHLDVLKYLVIEAGGRLDARARDGMLPIHAAAQTGCLDVVKWMILDRGVDPNARDGDGATPLHFAASRGHLGTVRWLLRHGARLQLDRHGKSPINDAAENHHMECLNVLVAAGADCNGKQISSYKHIKACTCSPGGDRCSVPECINNKRSPFYLHSPPPQDGLYINPMQRSTMASHSEGEESSGGSASSLCSSAGSGWYLHGARVRPPPPLRRLFPNTTTAAPPQAHRGNAEGQEAPLMTVKAEIHSSSSGAASDASDVGDNGRQHHATHGDHTYEDIYIRGSRNRSNSRDSGSHSRPGSAAAIVVDHTLKQDVVKSYEEIGKNRINGDGRRSSITSKMSALSIKSNNMAPSSTQHSPSSGVSSASPASPASSGDEAPPPPPPPPPPPGPLLNDGDRGVSTETDASGGVERSRPPNLVNKHLVLPFIPPTFQDREPTNRLIKPSEYLRSVGRETSPKESSETEPSCEVPEVVPPLPPPAPPQSERQQNQPLSAISVQELSSVRLRRTDKMPAGKTLSAPARSMSLQCLASEPFRAQKVDLIEELKMSKDISGIRALRMERAKMENAADKEVYQEYTRQFTVESFVEQIPERDASGNVIPAWKRQMLARRAAERAKRELERQLASEAERRRAMAIPAWKRQLLARRESTDTRRQPNDNGIDASWRGPTRAVSIDNINFASCEIRAEPLNRPETNDNEQHSERSASPEYSSHSGPNGNGNGVTNGKSHNDTDDEARIIPWRAQLRKTNSKLNLLE